MATLIASWGSSGSGKTTVALALAAQLAARGKNTLVLSADCATPALPVWLPGRQIGREGSLSGLLQIPEPSTQDLKGRMHLHPDSSRIAFLGMAEGDSPVSVGAIPTAALGTLRRLLDGTAYDFLLLDCCTNPVQDPLTLAALKTAEQVLRCITPDVRGITFERTHLSYLSNMPDMEPERQIRILNPIRPVSPHGEVLAVTGQADFLLPESGDIHRSAVAGRLLSGSRERYGIQFDKQMSRLAERMVRDE